MGIADTYKLTFFKLDIDKFMEAVAKAFAIQNNCSSEIVALPNGENVYIFGRCQKFPEVDPDKIIGKGGINNGKTDNLFVSDIQGKSNPP